MNLKSFLTTDASTKIHVVKRRFKEFVMLDTKLRQFHGEPAMNLSFPSKKTFRNMEKAFIEARGKELEQYLGTLITYPRIQDSQILASFLSPDSDPGLFLPDTVTSATGKILKKAVPMLKKDVRGRGKGGGRERREGGEGGEGREGGSERGREEHITVLDSFLLQKNQHYEELAQTLLQVVEPASSNQPR